MLLKKKKNHHYDKESAIEIQLKAWYEYELPRSHLGY